MISELNSPPSSFRQLEVQAFDASANGTSVGEGAGIILLKPLETALRIMMLFML